jgi:ferrochelatase
MDCPATRETEKTAVILANLGTPKSPRVKDVWRYLVEFLTDPRVIDLPWLRRQLLVRSAIVPRRCLNSAKSYQAIWTDEGSPLLVHGINLKNRLQEALGDKFVVELGMRYQEPSLASALNSVLSFPLKQMILLPLFPQYASATTGSVHEEFMRLLSRELTIPKLTFIANYADHPALIQAFLAAASRYDLNSYDHILFSFHGLPKEQLKRCDRTGRCLSSSNCCQNVKSCYAAQCHKTAAALIKELQIPENKLTICFQSRLGKAPWIAPYASDVIAERARRGEKKILVFCPSFVSDCLDTLYEIGVEYQHLFRLHGGETLELVEGLNSSAAWVDALKTIVLEEHNP